jgi:hypothetical protein
VTRWSGAGDEAAHGYVPAALLKPEDRIQPGWEFAAPRAIFGARAFYSGTRLRCEPDG